MKGLTGIDGEKIKHEGLNWSEGNGEFRLRNEDCFLFDDVKGQTMN